MANAKMKILLPLVVWITWMNTTTAQSFGGIGFGIKQEVFFLNLEDGYFGCQVNESTDVLQLFELTKLCDGTPNCYLGSDELTKELKCTDNCRKNDYCQKDGCHNGACLDGQCYCNDGFGGCSCEVPDENECKYRPCDVFAHCTNSLGSFHCTCFPGYQGDGFHCEDINECDDPAVAARCVANSECCNLPAHFLCKCLPGYEGDGEVQCFDIDECRNPNACGPNAICQNTPGNYTCVCPEGFHGNPFTGCNDLDECQHPHACGPGAICQNVIGGRECYCPPGYEGDAYSTGCRDTDECSRSNPCGRNALCSNLDGSFKCTCPPGFIGNPLTECSDIQCRSHDECTSQLACINKKCQNPCAVSNPCTQSHDCKVQDHQPVCVKVCQCQRNEDCGNINFQCDGCQCVPGEPRIPQQCTHCPPGVSCDPITGACHEERPKPVPKSCKSDMDCLESEACYMSQCQDPCKFTNACAKTAKCQTKMHRPICSCPTGYEGNPATNCFKTPTTTCIRNEECALTEACIGNTCQRPCDVKNPCVQHAVCINTNHGSDCSCEEGFHGNGYVECQYVDNYKPICQYNEDCPPNKLCDRLNRICINPCDEDSCGENAECYPKDHGIECRCLPGYEGNPYTSCSVTIGCRSDSDCPTHEACIAGLCSSPCKCGTNAVCDVLYHVATCKCPPGYQGDALVACRPPRNPCDPNPCGLNALCELDNGNPICFCPKGLTGNPFKNCIPEGDECAPNPCGPNSGCRVVGGNAVCFCLPEYEGTPPQIPCALPTHPCDPSPCGPNTQCAVLSNGFAKCTCLPGFIESPNTIRGCIQSINPCEPNPCGHGAFCDPLREPICFCPAGSNGNPFKHCVEPKVSLCTPGPCGPNADCYISNNAEQCYCKQGYIGNPYSGCRLQPASPCIPNPCGPGAQCIFRPEGDLICRCPEGMGGDPVGPGGCHGYECVVDDNCPDNKACMGYRCKDPCPGACGVNANCKVERHHPTCTCKYGLFGNPIIRCYDLPQPLPENPCLPSPCGSNTFCQNVRGRAVCSCLPDFQGDPTLGCQPECVLNSDCPLNKACLNRHCIDPCAVGHLCGVHATCQVRDHTATCLCPQGFMGNPFYQCIPTPKNPLPSYPNVTVQPCTPSPCNNMECNTWGNQIAICDPCLGPEAPYNPQCRPECLINADCPFDRACLGYTCSDPCPGSCGVNALCSVVLHTPICSCPEGLVGDPFQHCSIPLHPEPHVKTCEAVRCGENAECRKLNKALSCVCKPGFYGNPWIACRPECVINTDCLLNKACINNKCEDPCAGVCGVGAQCDVINHIPICSCPSHYTGDPFVSCYEFTPTVEPIPGPNPCDPSPCGPFSRCLISHQGFATCSCLPNYLGVPPVCKPECIVSSDCPQNRACVNQKCFDPCLGTCGANALCTVINHNPICSCTPGQQGDPFVGCYTPQTPDLPKTNENPCVPSPCGPNSICQLKENRPVCSCIANYIGSPPYCRPECTISQECPKDKACFREKCIDPCIELCGRNAKCDVINHNPFCSCKHGYQGDAFIGCSKIPVIPRPMDPCTPSPCAENSQCTVQDNIARCTCIPPYIGNPYVGGCKPECTMNSECASHLACLSQHCRDPCQGLCGINAECSVVNHVPVCACGRGLIGDPFTACRQQPIEVVDLCDPSPCGPNSVCRIRNEQAICSCQVGYFGTPPACRPECLVTSECTSDKACINQKCQDPCIGTCGIAARCQVHNHNPICSCPPNHIGDPFLQCSRIEKPNITPCVPSPCGANAECRTLDNRAVCSCLPNMYGTPPNCRPECLIDQDCPLNLACVGQKCKDPCKGSCGFNANCNAVNHRPICSCLPGFEGDPFTGCNELPATERTPPSTPCFPSPCGPNAECREKNGAGACSCLQGFHGDPYDNNKGCHRECEVNDDCKSNLACIAFKCVDPCPGTCGALAECTVNNHIPTCSCPPGFTGDAFFQCREIKETPKIPENPCQPTPCGPNSQCREVNKQAVCSCLPNYIGSPPNCRPECVVSSECPLDKACVNQKCSDPCPNTCGLGAQCTTRNHNPICACPPGYNGDPFLRCAPQPVTEEPSTERPASCFPSPCGSNSQCRIVENNPVCSCLPDFLGAPPNCRPECVISNDCDSQKTCIKHKCQDPCPGTCGINAECHVINHIPICTCIVGHTGDPFSQCNVIPEEKTQRPLDPCNPSPCGPNAECNDGICTCISEYTGNPYESCRPECVLSTECSRDKACIRNKCKDPCPNTCGQNARCDVINHIPTCSCPDTLTGDPFTLCRVIDEIIPRREPCNPSPCGPNSQCKNINEHAVCSCIQGYQGQPPSCKPECIVNSECPSNRACVNQKCIDPCPGSCGLNAECKVRNYSPICSCREGYTGDPFQNCREIVIEPTPTTPLNPCNPSPCGPNSLCRANGDTPSCSCAVDYIGTPPNCRPECVINPDCPSTQACINNKCKDPCPGSCGSNAECSVISHTVSCTCTSGYTGNPFVQCVPQPAEKPNPCEPSPCGPNAECRQRNGAGSCVCIQDYSGNPYEGCKPECVLSSDCPSNKACMKNKCIDPCPGICGQNAECSVINHVPACTCLERFIGNPFVVCNPAPLPTEPSVSEPCSPSPCGPYSQCREVNNQAVCSCLPDYIGSPPNCKPECIVSSECPSDRACHKFKCANPCTGACGIQALCQVINHAPICSCKTGMTGDPFTRCYELPPAPIKPRPVENPCVPSPCGSNAECRVINDQASCSCQPNYLGSPPNCRPECLVNTDCASNLACITEKCRDPCTGSCGFNTECRVQNHIPICSCLSGYTGDAFSECSKIKPALPSTPTDPCNPSPCGQNAQCDNGICTCLTLYRGDPYLGCRPECTMNSDCSPSKACSNLRCIDPCPGTCGQNAVCDIVNHIPTCSCPTGLEGDPFVNCRPKKPEVPLNPCQPSPCGPNSVCRVNNGVAVCSCQPGLIGSPPSCRSECVLSAECPLTQACLNQKCIDPCPGTCGVNAKCQVINHNPICSCIQGNIGDPFVRCYPEPKVAPPPVNPCDPTPCGPNSVCRVRGESPACSCLENYVGTPPNCRPECTINPECPRTLACINQKCRDPCPGSCGNNALCSIINHNPTCTCQNGYTGDPFQGCVPTPALPPENVSPCQPSPCGANAECREQNGVGACICIPDYFGNPYEVCRPQCVINSDCASNKACINNKCKDPCPGTCGQNANCQVVNHLPSCNCIPGYTGDPFRYCTVVIEKIPDEPSNPCQPSPCGPNSQCKEVNKQAVCSCLPNYIGSPPGCRPECTVSSECAQNKACINQKCADPCPGACGSQTKCDVINHSPICSCQPSYTGDPFSRCYPIPPPPIEPVITDFCSPNPCGPYSECRSTGRDYICLCLPNYIGQPPNCRPECTVNSDCSPNLACINQKCVDPCPGSCGIQALCSVRNHVPACTCPERYSGDPFNYCSPQPIIEPNVVEPCNPSPCGPNAQCDDGICTCLPEYRGDPYTGCRPECLLNQDCPKDQTCIRNKCKDPCPGTCGQNAECAVINHIPTCSCIQGFTGNAFVVCNPIPVELPKNPCSPSPCGPNSQCREINRQAVCSCVPGFLGTPPSCRPECVSSSECALNRACVNQKCIDPCPGTCGINSLCQVVNHNPICSCQNRYSGDPFVRCSPIRDEPKEPINPCQPSPCGPNSQCKAVGDSPSCSCLPEFIGSAPNCRPECVSNTECSNHLACINQKCKDPCPGTCGQNAECRVVSHTPNCVCLPGFTGDPFFLCNQIVQPSSFERPTPCLPSPCGANAECTERNGAGACKCISDYIGDPYVGCRPECTVNSDCPSNRACVNSKCKDPCPGACGQNAICQAVNHLPSCTCITGFKGDPYRYCTIYTEPVVTPPSNPCEPSPCGPNSQCREVNEQAVCSCLPNYIGTPPGCRPECTVSSECNLDKACVNQKCVDPCPGTCGLNANCQVNRHSPICSCQSGYTGDPFTRCYNLPPPPKENILSPNPCVPSPCGPNSQCREIGGIPSCSCLPEFIGSPPSCRPECTINSECSSNLACINKKCTDPCPGSCGFQAVCNVINHVPTCTCIEGYTGDPFTNCQPKPPEKDVIEDPCNPSPCGPNAECYNGICTCIAEYQGDPYTGCRPECILNNECPKNRACIRNKCIDPCPGTCGQNAECSTINHIPSCTCLQGFEGNAFVLCTAITVKTPKNPCNPTPCGPNSQCREINEQAVCSCVPGFIGSPPTCRPECVSSSECALNMACVNQKCIDPCPGTCGINALCQVVNHNPICSCPTGQSGDPFTRCLPIRQEPDITKEPCRPSPCGSNSQCREVGGAPSCSCLPEFIGTPPNCRPECVSNSECANHLACINQKCKDPCAGVCGQNAECRVISHTPNCVCLGNFEGNPFVQCLPKVEPTIIEKPTPCIPSPCGVNAQCREQNGAGACVCLPDHTGNPYEVCRPECTLNSDCPSNKACINNKCKDPCPGSCGLNAECQVINHLPACICISGFTGDASQFCRVVETSVEETPNPCQPSPCGLYSQCREVNGQAVCSCLPEYTGSPPNCRPECTVTSECPKNRACLNLKCIDPCPEACGLNTDCNVFSHSPICSCQNGYTGDPFTRCYKIPPPPPDIIPIENPCIPSPCGANSQCRDVGGTASCSCLENYIGLPPNCLPECTIHSDCSKNLACIQLKCRDPCLGACGSVAICNVVNHVPICLCPEGYTGDPFSYCQLKPTVVEPVEKDSCNPSPCGPNARCDDGICTCLPEYHGDPYRECRPECVLNADCARTLACINNKCKDPCIGTCGQNAQCSVYNHIPNCMCNEGFRGDAFISCQRIPDELPKQPCNPTPCGPNSQCREFNGQAVCSCVPGFIGSPPTCRPECITSSECALNQACVNQKCIDPCPGTCGLNTNCQVVNHNPICVCLPRYSGDPFTRCLPIKEEPVEKPEPCSPSPCGPNSQCREVNGAPSCSCLPQYIGSAPNCRPECVINTDCSTNLACINQKCTDPCPGVCGTNAECRVNLHTPNCMCLPGFSGNPFVQCEIFKPPSLEQINPCVPTPCGANAICRERNNAGSCVCSPGYIGNPYEGCRPECSVNSDCPSNRACINNKCKDPCPGTCGQNADCQVINHLPSCSCISGYTGDPFRYCNLIQIIKPQPPQSPCQPSPCGPNSQCQDRNGSPICSCLPNYIGSPPGCRPECTVNSECTHDKACSNQKCVDPCPGTCGINAQCKVVNHNPICTCNNGNTGDPFTRCYPNPAPPVEIPKPTNPCIPSPCGLNSQCRDLGGQALCSCLPDYVGTPPNCKPECIVNSECSSDRACINQKCKDPCPGSCGISAVCEVRNHNAICICPPGYTGDAFTSCFPVPQPIPERKDPCYPNPCGPNAQCTDGICKCYREYQGDPYVECRPECLINQDCPREKSCINRKCKDPCPGTCGQNAECTVFNHYPSCTCLTGYSGDAFVICNKIEKPPPENPCYPSPCGPNSQCRNLYNQAICSCVPGYLGTPPSCRPECVSSSECALNLACINQKCVDPCPGTCGINALCQVVSHNAICTCPEKYSGDPFIRCQIIKIENPVEVENPCRPTPCGLYAQCEPTPSGTAKCTCLANYIGSPPNCRPECQSNSDCAKDLACINLKCKDPCAGSCGLNAKCLVVNHIPNCLCIEKYVGDPFTICHPEPVTPAPKPENPCSPSPCGPNAECRIQSNYAVCECLPEYHGNPYELCKPECLSNADCAMNRACIRSKCVDPCPGTCGVGADCSTTNHFPVCSCPDGYTGDAFTVCRLLPEPEPQNPCNPSPCGINTICRVSGQNAICECLPGFFGTPTAGGCKPECTISTDCDRNKACMNQKCIDPCRGTCGFAAICNVINHSPVCSCPTPLIGDPFTLCKEPPKDRVEDPCNPSPCNLNGECRVVNRVATCVYPECIINQDCPRDKACYSQKCRDPCQGACGLNALCQVVNHRAICSCPPGHVGSPEVQCLIEEEPQLKVECTRDSECTNDKACLNNRCMSPCTTSLCGQNAECRVQLHRAICTCRDGFTGNAQQACFEIGCRADSECPPTQACVNTECVDPCSFTSCGLNALCKTDYNHKARCYCPNNFRGDPFVRCERPECTADEECPYNLACRNERCYDPCNCGKGAVCRVTNHRPQCSCPPGYVGNPLVGCDVEPEVQPECRQDADCPKTMACFNGLCKNPCFETNPCGKNTQCLVIDSLPLRTMSCMCLPGYVGDADTECRREPKPEAGCKSSSECPTTDACINRQCVNPCAVSNPCASNAQCTPIDHKAVCKCPNNLIGNPFVKCYAQPQTRPECQTDSECSNDKSCINRKCQNPCELANPCSNQAECRTSFHRPTCSCPLGWLGNPQIACYKPECTSDQDCPYDKSCINEICHNPCSSLACGNGAECIVQRHVPQCRCPLGTQGNPLISCITGICHYNEDCADHEACDRLNRVCRPVCDEDTCADTARCVGQQHEPKCTCPAGTTGNPFIKCVGLLPPEPACTSDSECQPQTACINSRCMNPCTTEDVCTSDQECLVLDTLPLRTIMCQCPPDTIVDSSGRCVKIISPKPECVVDSECRDSDKCIGGICVEACRVDNCGVNALCSSRNHQAVCTCSPGYTGNPHYECANVPKNPIPIPEPECYRDSDCAFDRTCQNERCINPCITDNPCARTAFCSVRYHQAECKCPENYEGNPLVDCIAPLGPTVGCTSNSDCSRTESCINRICASPCNCGPNAECKVINHYPSCYCKPGYSGNAQSGCVKLGCQSDNECSNDKQCYNGQCINPCILGNPCAKNAECYGNNHRATCKCLPGFEGNPLTRCERTECYVDNDCPNNRACMEQRCVDPCSSVVEPPCAQNAICHVTNHLAGCYCPPNLPEGNPLSYCIPRQNKKEPQCEYDKDCPSKLACIRNECVNPCEILSPCHPSAQCSVSDTVPVRTMICSCPEGWVPNENGECHPVLVPIPPGCTSDSDCSDEEACINRLCTTPCDCGTNADCRVQNHRAICSCKEGFEGNPNIVCRAVGCRVDSECASGKACINGNCINPCLVKDNCGINAECFVYQNRAECRCAPGYRGNPLERCTVIGCLSNSDCPYERQCINAQCINPCIYDNPCSPRAECSVHNHLAVCRCPSGLIGNPYFDCIPEPQPECKEDSDCPSRLACLNNKCQDPCAVLEPCKRPAECQVIGTVPVRTMICVCPPGYISSGSGTCNLVIKGACASDSDCPSTKACFNGICKDPCNCGPNAECRIKNHKPVCTCEEGFNGNPELGCHSVGCRADSECSPQHTCINRKCIPVCSADGSSCGDKATCYGYNHRAVCDCPPGLQGNPRISCSVVGCRTDTDCPTNRACINNKCELPCSVANPCDSQSLSECKVYNHVVECICPPGTISDGKMGCIRREEKCRVDSDCPAQYACIGYECVNPCNATEPCGINADCTVLDTRPVRTMVCICLPGYQGNAAVRCNPVGVCREDKGYVQTPDGRCECAPNLALNENYECVPCPTDKGLKINERGHCVCALEKGLIIDERGNCVCPLELGYHFDKTGNCVPDAGPDCETDDDCPDHKYCNQLTKTCEDACKLTHCGVNAFCNATNHVGKCQCITGYTGDAEVMCNQTSVIKLFKKPDLTVNCLSDGIQVEISLTELDFDGVLYVKGHSKDEKCRRVVSNETGERIEYFKVHFGECGLIHLNGEASFVLVIQKHLKLVTYKAQAYHIKCVYHTGEQNVTLGFNVSMLTTAGTIANTGPPPTCLMKIVTPTGEEINAAEIGDNLMLQVEVQPGSIYGGFARSCVAKTMEDSIENEYIVTDENGCATDPTIFGEWDYNPDTQSLLASFNAFKFPSSDNIRFQCNIRVCFGKCQPVNCRGYNAFGRRKRSTDNEVNDTDVATGGDLLSGQLREEVTIQSNAILTLERREEKYPDPQTAANAQRAEEICVSMIGFIIALIITALLALVAVAVAVSCWLMAYRRRPKSTGPLPHPPEFPNPLFTTPEPMAEPSPDYLT